MNLKGKILKDKQLKYCIYSVYKCTVKCTYLFRLYRAESLAFEFDTEKFDS